MHNLAAAFVTVIYATTCLGDNHFAEQYPFSLTLFDDSENEYYLYWNFSQTDETIQFAVRVKTTGWVGFGISPNGQMPGSDVVIGWVDGDKSYFHDRYAVGRSLPPIDDMQDWFLISAAINDGYTELEFSRNFTTCDNQSRDLDIKTDTSRIVYSWNDNTPTVDRNSNGAETYTMNMHQEIGSASVNLLGGLPSAPAIPDNAMTFTVNVEDVEIPSDTDTTYWCKGALLQDLVENSEDNTNYIIQFGPMITETSQAYVHHILVYSCDILNDTTDDLGPGGHCRQQSERIGNCRGESGVLIAAWAVGGISFTFPENVAFPIGGSVSHRHLVIEIHYNNQFLDAGVLDSSGISFTYIQEPREHDAGVLFVGHAVSFYLVVPPGADNYTVRSYCPASCTSAFIPETGIKIFANNLHTHLAGIGVSLSVIRESSNGAYEEVDVIEKNLNYDFNYQQVTHLPKEITVMPGDGLLLNCYYDTSTRSTATLGGESTLEEMCLSFPMYYPKIELNNCGSFPAFNRLTEFVLNELQPAEQAAFIPLANGLTRQNVGNAANSVQWNDELIETMDSYTYVIGDQYSYCYSSDIYNDYTGLIPTISSYYSPPAPIRNCTVTEGAGNGAGDGASLVHMSIMSVMVLATVTSYILWN